MTTDSDQLAAEMGVARNMAMYATALDLGDHDLLRQCFTGQVVATYSGGNSCEGIDQITRYVTEALKPFSRTQHVMGASRLIHLDPGGCDVETYCVAYLLEREAARLWTRGLRYLDHMVRSDDRWQVTDREQIGEWMTATPAVSPESIWPGSVAMREKHKVRSSRSAVVGLSETTAANIRASSGITLGRVLENQAHIRPHDVAVVFPGGEYSYDELNRRANVIAHALLERGIGTGDRIAVLSENRVEYVVLLYAAAKIGAAVAALNWRQTPKEISGCIDLVEPSVVMLSGQFVDVLRKVSEAAAERRSWRTISFDSSDGGATECFADLEGEGPTSDPGVSVDPESCVTILYTSGTTGPSKGAAISHRALVARAGVMAAELRLSRDDAFIGWAPMFHMVTTDYMFITAILGGTFIVVTGFDVKQIVQALCDYRVGWFVLVPGTIDEIVEHLKTTGKRPLGVTAVGAMADLIPAARIAELTLVLDCPFFNSFGSTETGTIPSAGSLLATGVPPADFGKEQSAFCDAFIRTKDGRQAAPGEEGELLLRGQTMFSGYWNDEKASAEAFVDGWYHTGDIFIRSEDGKLHFAGRERYMIKSGGENVYPAEIERVMLSHAAVEVAVVVRVPDDRWGEVPRAFVALKPGVQVSKDQLLAFCNGKLARFMLPKWIEFLPEAEFPRNATGKVLRSELEKIPLGTG